MGWDERGARDDAEASAEDRGDTLGPPCVSEAEITYFFSGDVDGWIRREGDGVGDSRRRNRSPIEVRDDCGEDRVGRCCNGNAEGGKGRAWEVLGCMRGEWEGLRRERLWAWECVGEAPCWESESREVREAMSSSSCS